MNIGVFDSGRGGYLVAERLRILLPCHEYVVVDDSDNVPYGNKTPAEVVTLTEHAIQPLPSISPVIVLACNTASALAIEMLRDKHPEHRFVGFEPMLKPIAGMTTHGIVLATAATRASSRYQHLKQTYASGITIDEPVTDNWASLIEQGRAEDIGLTELDACVASGGDVISLSCTHYLALEHTLSKRYDGRARVIEPTVAVAKRLASVIDSLPAQ